MSTVGQIEKMTQARVIDLFRDQLCLARKEAHAIAMRDLVHKIACAEDNAAHG